jgi:prepilin-type N-terminal cleavage/methylation domain-containing protein
MITFLRSVRRNDESGFTLVELLVTVTIMSIAFVVVLGAIAVFLRTTSVHRTSADLDGTMRTYVERLSNAPYTDCATGTTYTSAIAAPGGYTASIDVRYWDGNPAPSGFATTCTTDHGAQQLTVTLQRSSNAQQDSLVIVKRRS